MKHLLENQYILELNNMHRSCVQFINSNETFIFYCGFSFMFMIEFNKKKSQWGLVSQPLTPVLCKVMVNQGCIVRPVPN